MKNPEHINGCSICGDMAEYIPKLYGIQKLSSVSCTNCGINLTHYDSCLTEKETKTYLLDRWNNLYRILNKRLGD